MLYRLTINNQPYVQQPRRQLDPLQTLVLLVGDISTDGPILISNITQLKKSLPLQSIDSKSSYFVAWLLALYNIPFYVFVLPRQLSQSVSKYLLRAPNGTIIATNLQFLPSDLDIRLRYLNNMIHVKDYTNQRDITHMFEFNLKYLNQYNISQLDNTRFEIEVVNISLEQSLDKLFRSLTTDINVTFIVLPEYCTYTSELENWLGRLYTFYNYDISSGFVAYASNAYTTANNNPYTFALRTLNSDNITTQTILFRYIPTLRHIQIQQSYLYYALLLLARLSSRTITVKHEQFRYIQAADNIVTQQLADTVLTDYLYTHYNKFYNEFVATGINVSKKILSTYLLEALHTLSIDNVTNALDKAIGAITSYLDDTISEVVVNNIQHNEMLGLVTIAMSLVFNIYNRVIRVNLIFEITRDNTILVYQPM